MSKIPTEVVRCIVAIGLWVVLFHQPGSAAAQTVRALTFDPARAGLCSNISRDLATSPRLSTIRAALLDPAVFGRTVQLNTTHEITAASLGGADIVLITTCVPLVTGGPLIANEERELLGEFIAQGGGLFVFFNNGAEYLASLFGATSAGYGDGGCSSTITTAPPVVGPFGSGAGCIVDNFRGFFGGVGSGTIFISAGVGASFPLGMGRAVIINDQEWVYNSSVAGCGNAGLNAIRSILFLNSVSYVIPTVNCFAFKTIVSQPSSHATCLNGDGLFAVVAGGSGPFEYRWQIESVPSGSNQWTDLSDGQLPGSTASVSGSDSETLSLANADYAASARYRCRITNTCGSIYSDAAALLVCHADYDCDGFVDGIDSDHFNNDFEAGNIAADYNGDGFVDGIDSDLFNNDFESGC